MDESYSSSLSSLGSITGGDGGGSLLREEEELELESESDEAMSFEFFQISLFIFSSSFAPRYSRDDIIESVYEHTSLSLSIHLSLADDGVLTIARK